MASDVPVRTEQSYVDNIEALPDDAVLAPGLTAGDLRPMMRRPAVDPPGSVFMPSIEYSSTAGEVGQMALYARKDPNERAPMFLYAHGGGFHLGHHYTAVRYLHPLAARGYVAATMTYRFEGEGDWPAPVEDAKCAVRWLRHHAEEIGGDPDRIVFGGDSAGALLALLVALTPGQDEGNGGWHDVSSAVQGLALFFPPVDLESTAACGEAHDGSRRLYDYFGDRIASDSPVNLVRPDCPPVLTMTGSADVLTLESDIRRFHELLERAGVSQRLEVFPGAPHSFDMRPTYYEQCLRLLLEFVENTVGPAS